MDKNIDVQSGLAEHIEVMDLLHKDKTFPAKLFEISDIIVDSFKAGGQLLVCGNGGSAADSQHISTELVSRFLMEREALNAEALTVNTSTITAIANDYSFDSVFSRQIEAKGRKGDVLLGLSTSGNSKNVINAVASAKQKQMKTVCLIGGNAEQALERLSDYCICVPSKSTPRIQEAHIFIGHILCEIIEKKLFSKGV